MFNRIVLMSLLTLLIAGCSSQGTLQPMPSDLQPSASQQNQAKLEQALTS